MVSSNNFSIRIRLTFNLWFGDSVIGFYGNQGKYNQAVIDLVDPYKPCGELLLKNAHLQTGTNIGSGPY